jgi:CheY-like chemotaxis protein
MPSSVERNTSVGAGASVLVVEDEAALGAAVADALRDAGFTVQRAGDGQEALDRVREQPFDLIVCDLKMPRLDGAAFYRTLEKTDTAMTRRILFVTGDVAGTDAERFLEDSGCRWLAKPFRLRDLLRTAGEMIG